MNRLTSCSFVLALLGTTPALYAQAPCTLVCDIQVGSVGSSPRDLMSCWGNTLYFSALTTGTGGIGRELYKWTPSGGCVLVKDIWPGSTGFGPNSSGPFNFVCCWTGGKALVFFSAVVPTGPLG